MTVERILDSPVNFRAERTYLRFRRKRVRTCAERESVNSKRFRIRSVGGCIKRVGGVSEQERLIVYLPLRKLRGKIRTGPVFRSRREGWERDRRRNRAKDRMWGMVRKQREKDRC